MGRGHRHGRGGRGSDRGRDGGHRPAAVMPTPEINAEQETFELACEIAEATDDLAEDSSEENGVVRDDKAMDTFSLMGLMLAARLHAGTEEVFQAALALSVKQVSWAVVKEEHDDAEKGGGEDEDEDDEDDPDPDHYGD